MSDYRFPVAGAQNRKAAVAVEVTAIFLDYLAPVMKAEAPFFMGALVVAIGGLVCDALCTAPVITHKSPDGGCPKPQWAWLNRLMDRLADDMVAMFPGCDELGTQIYMEVSR